MARWRYLIFSMLVLLGSTAVASAQTTKPATQPAGKTSVITGKVSAEGGKALPEMIVFLQPVNPQQKFAVLAEPVHVSQRDARFSPNVIIVAVGQAVDFSNDEPRPVEHNVFSRSTAKPFDLGLYRPGSGAKLVTFDKPGPVRLACSIHRFMDGVIYVCPTPFYARVNSETGQYRIENVPAGEWIVRTWQRNARFNEREVRADVAAGQPVELDLELSRH